MELYAHVCNFFKPFVTDVRRHLSVINSFCLLNGGVCFFLFSFSFFLLLFFIFFYYKRERAREQEDFECFFNSFTLALETSVQQCRDDLDLKYSPESYWVFSDVMTLIIILKYIPA